MVKLFLIIVVIFPTSLQQLETCKGPQPFIFGGQEAALGQFPYLTFMRYIGRKQNRACTSFLASEQHVLTAAHCFPREPLVAGNVRMYAGITDRTKIYEVDAAANVDDLLPIQKQVGKKIIIHQGRINSNHDIAIIVLQKPFTMTDFVQIAIVSTDKLPGPTNCTIIGWGRTNRTCSNTKLMYATGEIASPVSSGCEKTRKGNFYCITPRDSGTCLGDSGGPLVCDGQVKGLLTGSIYEYGRTQCTTSVEILFVDFSAEADFLQKIYGNSRSTMKNNTKKLYNHLRSSPSIMILIYYLLYF